MELHEAVSRAGNIVKQRNLFLVLSLLLGITSMALSIKVLMQEERIVMVPGLAQEVSISNKRVSSSYLEQMSFVFLSSLLDLTGADILHKRDLVLKYTSGSDESYIRKINEYFGEAHEKYKKFDLSTFFTVKEMEVDQSKLEVMVHGLLNCRYGREGFESMKKSYRLSYELVGGELRLKEFEAVNDDKENKTKK